MSTVEVWSTFVLVRWAEPQEQYVFPRDGAAFGHWTLTDDVGTVYRSHGGGGGSHGTLIVDCTKSFTPTPPREAEVLILTTPADGRVEIPLGGRG